MLGKKRRLVCEMRGRFVPALTICDDGISLGDLAEFDRENPTVAAARGALSVLVIAKHDDTERTEIVVRATRGQVDLVFRTESHAMYFAPGDIE